MTDSNRPNLTERQEQVLNAIREFITDHGYPPSIRELGALVGIRSTNGVSDHLKALERKGYLTRGDFKSRTLIPVDVPEPAFDQISTKTLYASLFSAKSPQEPLSSQLSAKTIPSMWIAFSSETMTLYSD